MWVGIRMEGEGKRLACAWTSDLCKPLVYYCDSWKSSSVSTFPPRWLVRYDFIGSGRIICIVLERRAWV